MKFVCPKCGHDQMEEIIAADMVSSPVTTIEPNHPDENKKKSAWIGGSPIKLGYGEPVIEGSVIRYQCNSCGHVLCNADGEVITEVRDLAPFCHDD